MRYSLVSVNKWNLLNDQTMLMKSDDIVFLERKMKFIKLMIKYCVELSPNNSRHKMSNLGVHHKIKKEIHDWFGNIHDLLSYNRIVIYDHSMNKYYNDAPVYFLVGGLIPNGMNDEYLDEKKIIKDMLSSKWFDPNHRPDFKYFKYTINY